MSIPVTPLYGKVVSATIYGDNYFYFWFNGQKITEDPNKEAIPHNAVNFTFDVGTNTHYVADTTNLILGPVIPMQYLRHHGS